MRKKKCSKPSVLSGKRWEAFKAFFSALSGLFLHLVREIPIDFGLGVKFVPFPALLSHVRESLFHLGIRFDLEVADQVGYVLENEIVCIVK